METLRVLSKIIIVLKRYKPDMFLHPVFHRTIFKPTKMAGGLEQSAQGEE